MSEQDTPPSGSRWEPTPGQPDDTPTSEPAAHPAPPMVPSSGSAERLDSETPAPPARVRNRGRAAMAGAGLALLLGGGLGGFAIGHAVAGDAGDGGTGGTGVASVPDGFGCGPGDDDGDHHGFGGQPPQGVPGDEAPGQDAGSTGSTGDTGDTGSET